LVQRFYWLIDGSLAGCSRPGEVNGVRPHNTAEAPETDDAVQALDRDLRWLRNQEVGAVLSLTESQLTPEAVTRHGVETLHLPVPDLTAPHPVQFQHALEFIDWQQAMGRAVAVHCLMGQGRTATVLAAYLIRSGIEPDHAIARLRAICPGAIGSPGQESALHAFAVRRDWLL
jgi:atypical dual specificity phosphatase